MKNITFSQTINWMTFLPRDAKKTLIDIMMPLDFPTDQKLPVLLYALTLIRRGRNLMAHNLKFISLDCSKYYKNLNKAVLRALIPHSLLSTKELHNHKYLTGIYGYIIFSLVLAPELITKLRACHNIKSTVTATEFTHDTPFKDLWDHTVKLYFTHTNIPQDLLQRMDSYLQKNKLSR